MSLAADLGQIILEQAVEWIGARTPRVYYMSYDPAPTKKDWLDLIEVIPPEYIILLAVCGLVALCYLGIRGVSVCRKGHSQSL